MSAAARSLTRRLLSAFFFALAGALFLLSLKVHAQVYIPDPCRNLEPGSFAWYFYWCFLGSAISFLRGVLLPGVPPLLVQ